MVLVCPGCKNQITLDDVTLPAGVFKVRCTGCGRTITAQRKEEPPSPQQPLESSTPKAATVTDKIKPLSAPAADVSSSVEGFVNGQIAAAKKEILEAIQALFRGASINPSGGVDDSNYSKRALVCSGDPSTADALAGVVKGMGYQPQICVTAADSLKNLDTQHGLILIDPSFTDDLDGAKKLIGRINTKKGIERRQILVVLLSSTQKSQDGNSAFMSGVNLIVNKADVSNIESFIRQSQRDFQQLYSSFRTVAEER